VLLLGTTTIDDPSGNLRAIGRGELKKSRSEEPWLWPDEFCLKVPAYGWAPCWLHKGHAGPHSWESVS
jgi:hypothetical protein